MRRFLWLCLALLSVVTANAQNDGREVMLRFRAGGNGPISGLLLHGSTQLSLDVWRFYLSDVRLWKDGQVVWHRPELYHLADMADSSTHAFQLNDTLGSAVDAISFRLGIDSLTNVSGAMGGDIDPTKGMYWSWQSGYINFKLEGKSPLCPTKDRRLHLHLGGYLPPNGAARTVMLPFSGGDVVIVADVGLLLDNIDVGTQRSVMSPSPEAMSLSDLTATIFSIHEK